MDISTLPFYDFSKLNSYAAPWMIACGMRNMGKTYGCSRDAVKRFIKNGEQFIYLRRTKEELATKDQFFDAFMHEFPDHDFRVVGKQAHIATAATRGENKRDWKICGHFATLTQAQSFKGGNFPDVGSIIFDEFIAEKGSAYSFGGGNVEVAVLRNFYYTIARWRAGKVRLYMLSNSIEMSNPYFIHFNIDPSEVAQRKHGIASFFDNFVVVHIIDNQALVDAVDSTTWGKFLRQSDPDYAAYAVDNKFSDAHDNLLGEKPAKALHQFNLETPSGKFSLWQESTSRMMYVQRKLPKDGPWLTMIANNVEPDMPLLARNDKLASRLRTGWRSGTMFFDSKQTRNIFMEVFK